MAPRCDSCAAPAVVVSPGRDAERAEIGIVLALPRPDRAWCLDCARAAGWPWVESERAGRSGKRERRPAQQEALG